MSDSERRLPMADVDAPEEEPVVIPDAPQPDVLEEDAGVEGEDMPEAEEGAEA
jgi:hypothetical protein